MRPCEQRLPRPRAEVFAFLADARNLAVIAPPWLHFHVVSPEPIIIRVGTHIHYRIRWRRTPLRWLTKIRSWNPPAGFTDVQIRGAYRLWRHTHTFEALDNGTLVRDTVRYALPSASWTG